MLPNNALSSEAMPASMLAPDDLPFDPLFDCELGGIALNDPSQGLQIKVWQLRYIDDQLRLGQPGRTDDMQFTVPDVKQVALAFDQNMRPVYAWQTTTYSRLVWFDAQSGGQVATDFPDVTYPCLTLDDKRPESSATSDVIFAYIRDNRLCYRQQRDRYQVERVLASVPPGASLQRIGLTTNGRLQFNLFY